MEKTELSALTKIRVILDRGVKIRLAIGVCISIVLALLDSAAIALVLPLVDLAAGKSLEGGVLGVIANVFGKPARSELGIYMVLAVVGLFILKDLTIIWFRWWQSGIITRESVRLSSQMLRNVLQSDLAEFQNRKISEVMAKMSTGVGQVMNSAVQGFIQSFMTGVTILLLVAVLFVATPLQALVAIVYFGIAAALYAKIIKPKLGSAGVSLWRGSHEAMIAQLQALNGFKEVKIRHSSEVFVQRYYRGASLSAEAQREGNYFSGISAQIMEILFIIGIGILLTLGFVFDSGAGIVGSLALFVAAGFRLLPNISGLIRATGAVRVGLSSLDEVYEELREEAIRTEEVRGEEKLPFRKELKLEGVQFKYPSSPTKVINGVDLVIPFGSSVALVGGSGAGKTTLANITLGLLEPTAGKVLVDGVDISGKLPEWHLNCGMVAQDVYMIGGPLVGDVTFDEETGKVNEGRLQEAIRNAQLDGVVASLEGGVYGETGEFGGKLSGGQRQRVGIARALYREPSFLVLDEATSALDNETEHQFAETVDSLKGETTVLIVAHRLSTVKNADKIVYMRDGKIAGAGSFAELRASNEEFARLVKLGKLDDGEEK